MKKLHALPHALSGPVSDYGGFGLALSAGGARGAYQLGCWRAFSEKGITFSAIAGSSIGALNGALIAQGDWRRGYDLWMELTRQVTLQVDYEKLGKLGLLVAADVGWFLLPIPNLAIFRFIKYASAMIKMASAQGSIGHLRKYGLFKLEGVIPILEKHIDMEQVIARPKPLFVTARAEPQVKKPLGASQWFNLQDRTAGEAWSIIGASMAVPLVFSPIEIDGKAYSDGGVGHWLPIKPLYESGVRNIIAIGTKAGVSVDESKYPGSRILVIGPKKPLGRFPIATFRFTEAAVLAWMEEGYRDASEALKKLKI